MEEGEEGREEGEGMEEGWIEIKRDGEIERDREDINLVDVV